MTVSSRYWYSRSLLLSLFLTTLLALSQATGEESAATTGEYVFYVATDGSDDSRTDALFAALRWHVDDMTS